MSSGEEDFGDLADEEFMFIATQAERQNIDDLTSAVEFPIDRAPKRRRLNGCDRQSLSRHQLRSDSEEDNSGDSVTSHSARPSPGLGIDTESFDNKPKSKYKIHIPKQATLPQDTFYTQVPPSSQSPYRIRGCYWQKPRSGSPPSPTGKNASIGQQVDKLHHGTTGSAALPSPPDVARAATPLRQAIFPQYGRQHSDKVPLDAPVELENLPSDAVSSPNTAEGTFDEPIEVLPQGPDENAWMPQNTRQQKLVGPQKNLKQTTLFGGSVQGDQNTLSQTQSNRRRNWPAANQEEAPTHHKLDQEAMKTWVYPTNLGTIRDYQFNIVARGLYHNLLVALPTGLGKTFIAATIMLNWFRWTKDAQIVFVAPTRPLVSQQVQACFNIVGIPRSATTLLTGSTAPGLRAEEWLTKRVFFMTPQTIINDLKTGIADPKRIVLLVVDEAHRATGGYAYVEVVKFLRRFNTSFRVLALTATPGSSVETVQEVIDGLGISRVEIRTEESLDIRQYVHTRKIDTMLFEYSPEITMVMELFAKALQPTVNKLVGMNAYWNRDPMALTPYGCTQARQRWMVSDAGRKADFPVKGMVNTIFSLLASLAHSIELLKYHGIGPFYHKITEFRNEASSGGKGGKYRKEINDSVDFQKMMTRVGAWVSNNEFVGHPKLEYLRSVVLNHFLDAGDGRGAAAGNSPANTRVMVFVHYRDSAEEVARVLKRNEPMIRPHVFVGQANSKGSEGMDQKKQLDIIEKFKSGVYNTLVATSIGEEGLDIGEVDLIVCYDSSASPIRMLQRMGRTGRKRAGNIVILLMKGKEETNFVAAKDNYEKMQQMIAAGTRFTFHEDLSPRIVPRECQPVVDKQLIEIPLENTQRDLPEPKKRGRPPKRPLKKFHMPDGVRKGFTKASKLDDDEDDEDDSEEVEVRSRGRLRKRVPEPEIELDEVPPLESVFLTPAEELELERTYLDVGGDTPQIVEGPRLDAFPYLQRSLRYTKYIGHSRCTKRLSRTLNAMHVMTAESSQRYARNLHPDDVAEAEAHATKRAAFLAGALETQHVSPPSSDSRQTPRPGRSSKPTKAIPDRDLRPKYPTSDDEDAYDVGSLADFVDDDPILADGAMSSASSPPLSSTTDKPFYQPVPILYPASQLSEDLPDVSTIVRRKRMEVSSAAVEVGDKGKRKGRRMVVDSSEDE